MENEKDVIQDLIKRAMKAREYSYSPYSNFSVGAAILSESGKIYTGCNIESASYTPTICAERVALFKAVSEGERKFKMLALVGGPKNGEKKTEEKWKKIKTLRYRKTAIIASREGIMQ